MLIQLTPLSSSLYLDNHSCCAAHGSVLENEYVSFNVIYCPVLPTSLFYSFHNFLQKMSYGLCGFSGISNTLLFSLGRESSDSVVECLTRDREATASSLTGVTALCPSARHINSSLVLVQPRKTCPYITERLLM